jgi:Domain of unknown function (DUF4384)
MRVSKISVYGFALALVVITPLLALTQDPSSDDEVRGVFLKSRQKAAATRRRPPSSPARGGDKAAPAPPKKPAESSEPVHRRTTAPAPPEAPLALGYTLYQKGSDGEPARVNPDQVFHSGTALRLTIEPNFDGYLYMFHTADDGPPKMLYPNSRLSRGDNRVSAHRLYEVPSSLEKDEEDQWLVIYGKPAVERLFLIVTREPLPGVPTGEMLLAYCRDMPNDCPPWQPPQYVWQPLVAKQKWPARASSVAEYGQKLNEDEIAALKRDIGLKSKSPGPSVVMMHKTADVDTLTAVVKLVHQ